MNTTRTLLFLCCMAGGCILLFTYAFPTHVFSGRVASGLQPDYAMNTHSSPQPSIAPTTSNATLSPLETLLSSPALLGTTVPNGIRLSEDNHVVIDQGLLDTFDYFLQARRSLGHDAIKQGIIEYIALTLPAPAAGQSLTLLENYLRYMDALSLLSVSSQGDRQQTLRHLRRDHFGADVAMALWPEKITLVR